MHPSIGAVVVNFNGGEKVLRCVQALQSQTLGLDPIVLVDNGSSDDSVGRVRAAAPDVHILELGENYGLPFARNAGLQALNTDLAISVDADLYLEPSGAERLVAAQQRSRAAVVCPRIVLPPKRTTVQCDGAGLHFLGTLALRHAYLSAESLPATGDFVGATAGGCLLLDRKVVLDAGGFDQRFFFYFEDLELSLRLRSRGYRMFWEPKALVLHDWGTGTPGLAFRGNGEGYPARRAYLTMRNRWLTVLTHYRFRTLLVLAPALLSYEVATLAFALVQGRLREWGRAWIWLFRNRGAVHAGRRAASQARKVPDRELLEGGPIPLAPGLLRSQPARVVVAGFGRLLNAYWRIARHTIG